MSNLSELKNVTYDQLKKLTREDKFLLGLHTERSCPISIPSGWQEKNKYLIGATYNVPSFTTFYLCQTAEDAKGLYDYVKLGTFVLYLEWYIYEGPKPT